MRTARHARLLELLHAGSYTKQELASALNIPLASVVKHIRALRADGWDIQYAGHAYQQIPANDGWDDVA